jgi:hypothetical protein
MFVHLVLWLFAILSICTEQIGTQRTEFLYWNLRRKISWKSDNLNSLHEQLSKIRSPTTILLLQSALQPLVGFRSAQLSLSILSRKVLQSAVASGTSNPPTWGRTRDLERSNFRHKRLPASEATRANPASEGGTMGEKWPRIFAESGDFHVTSGFFYMP